MLRAICALVLAAAVDASAGIAHPNLALRGGGKAFPKLPDSITPGVLYGDQVKDLIQHAKDNCYAIPAVNCVSSGSINSVLEAAAKYKSPVMIQFSNGGSQYYAGKSVESPKDTLKGCVLGAIAVCLLALTPSARRLRVAPLRCLRRCPLPRDSAALHLPSSWPGALGKPVTSMGGCYGDGLGAVGRKRFELPTPITCGQAVPCGPCGDLR